MLAAQNQAHKDGWYSISNLAKDEAEVWIYGVIGGSFFDEGIEALQFARDLKALNAKTIHVRVNSPGGSVFDALAIRNALQEHPAHIRTHIDGVGASAAAWVASFDDVVMAPKSRLFIHEPHAIVLGSPADMRKEAEVLDSMGDDIADLLAERAGGWQEWRDKMRDETWFTDQEAVDAGLADEIAGHATERNTFDVSILGIFKNTPADLLKRRSDDRGKPSIRDAENALRDAGFSRNDAKAVLNHGWNDLEQSQDVTAGLEELLATVKAAS